jgi:hypothetical protein
MARSGMNTDTLALTSIWLKKIQISHIAHSAERSDNDPLKVMFCDVILEILLANQILIYRNL